MLVVLILTGLISAILFQGLSQVFGLQRHLGAELDHLRQDAMLADWFRQVIEGLQPDYDDGSFKFTATERRITGLTTNPLTGEPGATAPFALELRFDNQSGNTLLIYENSGKSDTVLAWPGDRGRFVFIDGQQEEHDEWPPLQAAKPRQIPAVIRLEGEREGKPWILVAMPMGPEKPRPRPRDFLGGTR
jgi:hypothetical protein